MRSLNCDIDLYHNPEGLLVLSFYQVHLNFQGLSHRTLTFRRRVANGRSGADLPPKPVQSAQLFKTVLRRATGRRGEPKEEDGGEAGAKE